jgi:hypothetical protein
MKNVLLKNNLMNQGISSERFINIPNRGFLEYNYQFTKALSQDRIHYNEKYINKSMPTDLTTLNYKGIGVNMITCPAGGKVNIADWGLQEIKKPFMLGETEVTQELFDAVMEFNSSKFQNSNKNPVEHVTWYDCLDFCNRLSDYFGLDHCYELRHKIFDQGPYSSYRGDYPSYITFAEITFKEGANGFRLPKEWEWQIAAMAGTNNQYAGADDEESLKRVAWFKDNSGNKAHPVAQKLPNEWGFYDMSGNVSEWCENSDKPGNNNNHLADRVTRGSAWNDEASFLGSTDRTPYSPQDIDSRCETIGFRIARSI